MKTSLVIYIVSLLLTAASAFAEKCPVLAGVFNCPAVGGAPAFQVTVTQSGNIRKVVHYHWVRSDQLEYDYCASDVGVKNEDGKYGICHKDGLYISPSAHDLSSANRNEVNPKGNYVVTTFMGEPVMTCLRASP